MKPVHIFFLLICSFLTNNFLFWIRFLIHLPVIFFKYFDILFVCLFCSFICLLASLFVSLFVCGLVGWSNTASVVFYLKRCLKVWRLIWWTDNGHGGQCLDS